jgi:hypothetical protein
VKSDIDTQTSKFEKRKEQKKLKQYLFKSNYNYLYLGKQNKAYIKRNFEVLNAANNPKKEDTLKIINNIIELTERKFKCSQKKTEEEILLFIDTNIINMHKAISNLQLNTLKEVKKMEGKNSINLLFMLLEDGYPHVAKSLQEDLIIEIESLKEQYDEERRKGVDKIKQKNLKENK